MLLIIDLLWGNTEAAIFAIPYAFAIWIVVDLLAWLFGHPLYKLLNRLFAKDNPAPLPGYLQFIKA
jgi:hypothetical protein